jgi:hypothetical protein
MLEKLSPASMRWSLLPQEIGCNSRRDLTPLDSIIGQERLKAFFRQKRTLEKITGEGCRRSTGS